MGGLKLVTARFPLMITLHDIQFLASPAGEQLMARLAGEDLRESNTLRLLTMLRKGFSGEQAGAALEMARLRVKAVDKFGESAGRMLFTREALEQASDQLVRAYRAREIQNPTSLPPDRIQVREVIPDSGQHKLAISPYQSAIHVIDACCGIGADALAFAAAGAAVTGLDMDAVRVEIARYNAAALELAANFEVADVRDGLADADVVFFDPARRDESGKRIYDVERYQPPLSLIKGWQHQRLMVKLSPGVDLAQLQSYGGMVEFISVDGDLKEAVLHSSRETDDFGLKATLLSGGEVHHWHNPSADFAPVNLQLPTSEPRTWLVEPDAAVIRAGLVQAAAAQSGGALLDETIAYFTTDKKPESPWLRAWRVLDWMAFNLKHLRAYLRQHNIGQVTVKKRGSAITPDELIPRLKLKGNDACTLVLTRCKDRQIVLVCQAL